MKRSMKLGPLLLVLYAAGAHAQLYKWVGSDGKVTYSDAAPPASAKQVETKSISGSAVSTAGFPFELAEAVRNSPVTLYTADNCAPCDDGRKHLTARGIPFSEKTVNTNVDLAQFHQAGGEGQQLPLLIVGRDKERGFAAGAWNRILSAAGYPETSRLPKAYHAPQAQAAAPVPASKPVGASNKAIDDARASAAPPAASELPPASGNAPPGFRF